MNAVPQPDEFNAARFAKTRGYNPAFYARVMAKHKAQEKEREKARKIEAAKIEAEEKAKNRTVAQTILEEQRKIANDAIKAANAAARRFQAEQAAQGEGEATKISVSFMDIVDRISKATGVPPRLILGTGRSRESAFARHAVMYWTCRRTNLSSPAIGRLLKRDHTSVISGVRSYRKKRAEMGRNLPLAR